MTDEQAIELIRSELRRARKKWPGWPGDVVHCSAIVAEESGELVQASLDEIYSGGDHGRSTVEAVQTAAMAIRFLVRR